MLKIPLRDASAGPTSVERDRLTYAEAMESPCASCATSPCCTYLPLHTFKITNLRELDQAIYLLNFDRIELGLSATGEWSAYYRYPCRFLNRQDFSCTVHNTPRQPNICVHYNPYSCWYKRVLTKNVTDEFLRIDRQRMEFLVARIIFDESRDIVEVPTWETLVEGFAELPVPQGGQFDAQPALKDSATEAWEKIVLNGAPSDGTDNNALASNAEALRHPCAGCEAHCCTTLVFPHPTPTSTTSLDFLRFCLGFPGIELGISDSAWSIVVKTTCRHLQDNRCSIYGKPERPLLCKYYDACTCSYKPQFGLPRPPAFLRVRLEQFDWLAECFSFDQSGAILELPPVEALREHVEERWRAMDQVTLSPSR